MGRRGGSRSRSHGHGHGHGFMHRSRTTTHRGSSTIHVAGSGTRGQGFDTKLSEDWTDTWKNSLCDIWSRPAISAEACCCYCCALGKISNVLKNREWTEEDSSCNDTCCMSCFTNIFYCLGNGFFGGPLRCGVMARYQIGHETECCQSCMIAYFCPCCNANQMLLELTDRGEFPGGIVCAKRPSNCPERPPPPPLPTPMGIDVNQLTSISTEMAEIQTQVTQYQNGEWQPEQTKRYQELNNQLQQLSASQQQMQIAMTTGVNGSTSPLIIAGGVNTFNTSASANNSNNNSSNMMLFGTADTSMSQQHPPPPPPSSGFATWENTMSAPPPPPPPPPPGSGGLSWGMHSPETYQSQTNAGWQL